MKTISKLSEISTIYTNHLCQTTTVSVVDVAQIPSRHTMCVTGHKAEYSFKTYSGRTNEKRKKLLLEK